MTFTTLTFLFFLVLVFTSYWAMSSQRSRNALVVVASYVFYGWWDARFCILMLVSSLLDYYVAQRVEANEEPARRKRWLFVACAGNLSMLGFFKYFNFFMENGTLLAGTLGIELSYTTLHIVLPVGISFYTFQTMSYTIDVYRRRLPAGRSLVDFLAYVAFFPQLVAGPIERAHRLLPQFQTTHLFREDQAREGLRFMLWGFFKKIALADNLGLVADGVYGHLGTASSAEILLGTLCFAFQIYCDFSAYSDIAVGTAKLFGFELMRNFAFPYFSRSVAEFWRRWHISLSGWFSDYVYVSLGGNRVGRLRRVMNVMITFLLSGLWHGASWNFVAWGALNGAAVLPEILSSTPHKVRATDVPGGESLLPAPASLLRMLATFSFVTVTWVYFRAASLAEANAALLRVASGPWDKTAALGLVQAHQILLVAVGLFFLVEWVQRRHWQPLVLGRWPRPIRWTLYTAMIWLTLGGAPIVQIGRFIYFQF